ncbi:hypothetical protein LZG04_04980 [Saccharothrix sp. S26]|uniref:hypothetical protein n=1 Tax=Saccharothrix sp. S26 TaxID=2907215 RepID=UPI001F2BC1AD|nr:hypothetical protein [Saccharothrix sp. S26]MCE6994168.1 hypothetical protein [Saccharothrix sp. S26]
MFTNGGIAVDSWVRVEAHCSIETEVVGDEAQFTFSGRRGGELSLVVTEAGLEKVVEHFQQALAEIRSADVGELGTE